jgi:hypothetical protein
MRNSSSKSGAERWVLLPSQPRGCAVIFRACGAVPLLGSGAARMTLRIRLPGVVAVSVGRNAATSKRSGHGRRIRATFTAATSSRVGRGGCRSVIDGLWPHREDLPPALGSKQLGEHGVSKQHHGAIWSSLTGRQSPMASRVRPLGIGEAPSDRLSLRDVRAVGDHVRAVRWGRAQQPRSVTAPRLASRAALPSASGRRRPGSRPAAPPRRRRPAGSPAPHRRSARPAPPG